jgi:hypothetical protein
MDFFNWRSILSRLVRGSGSAPLFANGQFGRAARVQVEELEDRCVPYSAGQPLSQNVVSQIYVDLLQRNVDPTGLSFWSGQLNHGQTIGEVVYSIESSPEYKLDEVNKIFETLLNRTVDTGSASYWVSFLDQNGVEVSEAAVAGSQEFFDLAGQTNSGFLALLYNDVLNRPLDQQGAATYGAELAGGLSRGDVALQILTSPEYRTDLVNSFYSQFLHRPADAAGLSFWVGQLNAGASNQDVIAAMINENEFIDRVPNMPIVLMPNSTETIPGTTTIISGTAESGSLVKVFRNGSEVGQEQLAGGQTNFSISVPLTSGKVNKFGVTATNDFGNESSPTLVPDITQGNTLVVTPPSTQLNPDGGTVANVTVTAKPQNSSPIVYSASNLPSGLTINSSTGVISGKISSAASNISPYNVKVTATEGNLSGSTNFAWVVTTGTMGTTPLPFSLTDPAWQFLSTGERIWDVKKGTGATATATSTVTVNYTGYLTNGTIFDSNTLPQFGHQTPFTANLSSGVIKGWMDAIPGMQVGGERRLDIPSTEAYGANPPSSSIPANAELVFDVTLLKVA